MKIIKHFGLLILAVAFSLLLCGCSKGGPDMTFAHTDDGNGYNLVKCEGYIETVNIPAEYNGLPVVGIGEAAFKNLKVEKVTI